jgi:hypothetical protein
MGGDRRVVVAHLEGGQRRPLQLGSGTGVEGVRRGQELADPGARLGEVVA